MAEEELQMVKTMLRSVLLSSKEGVPPATLYRDYREVVGEPLPYKKFGFPSLDDFVRSVPDVVRVRRLPSGEFVFQAVADESTAHIERLVAKQRGRKKLKKATRRPAPQHKTWRPAILPHPSPSPMANIPPWARMPQHPQPLPKMRSVVVKPQTSSYSHKENIVVVRTGNSSSGTRTVKIGENRLLERAMHDAQVNRYDRVQEQPQFGARYEVPPRFRRHSAEDEVVKLAPSKPAPKRPAEPVRPKVQFATVEDGAEYMESLKRFCQLNNLTMKFDSIPTKSGGFVSSIQLQGTTYGSEDVYRTAKEAEEAVAKMAVTKMKITEDFVIDDWEEPWAEGWSDSQTQSLPPDDVEKIKGRVKEILATKSSGLWGSRLPHEYLERYEEDPPPDLLKMAKRWTNIVRMDFVPNTDRAILYPVLTDTNKNKDLKIPIVDLLPEDSTDITVYLTYINSPSYFCLQREDSCVDDIAEELASLCKDKVCPDPEFLEKGRFCAGVYSGDKNYTRAQILDVKDDGVSLLFVDYGNVEVVDKKSLHWLNEEIASKPIQAINCSLYGIEPLKGEEEWGKRVSKLFAAEVKEEALIAIPRDRYDNLHIVELFLKSDSSVSVNQRLVDMGVARSLLTEEEQETEAEEEFADPDLITLPEDKEWDVLVTYLETSTNSVMLRLVGEEYSDKMDQYQLTLEETFKKSSEESPIVEGAVYVAYDDGLYLRVRVEKIGDKKVQCYFLDHGDTDGLIPEQLRLLDPKINKLLPYQAIEVCLCGLEEVATNVTALGKLCDLAIGKTCVAEVVLRGECPSVVLFDTSGDVDLNINDAILKAIEEDDGGIDTPRSLSPLSASDTKTSPKRVASGPTSPKDSPKHSQAVSATSSVTSEQVTKDMSDLKVTSDTSDHSESESFPDGRTLWNPQEYAKRPLPPSFQIPAPGQYLDVHVIFSHDPSNFTCIPYEQMPALNQLLLDMNEHFTPPPTLVLQMSDIHLGQLYAGHKDGAWYRVKACQFVSDVLLSVNLVDFGDFSVMTLDEIQPLPWKFCKLPLQAFTAKLGAVKPVTASWTEGAKFKFLEMAVEKDLVALILDNQDTAGVVSLRLIDTSTEDMDLCLDEVLVSKKMAQGCL